MGSNGYVNIFPGVNTESYPVEMSNSGTFYA